MVASLALAGCSLREAHDLKVVVIGDSAAKLIGLGRWPLATELVHAATTEGLVSLDSEGRIIPALADRWIVTDDGQSYIFRLRDGNWPDGPAISGESIRLALHQAIAGLDHTPLALDLDDIEDVRAMAGRVVEIRLRRPVPDFLQLLAQPELGLMHHGRGAGPMAWKGTPDPALSRDGGAALLIPIPPEKRGLPAVPDWAASVHQLALRGLDGGAAVAAFAAGQADIVLGGTFLDWPRTSRTTLGSAKPRIDPVNGLFGLAVTRAGSAPNRLLADPALREAIAMAIDRDALAAALAFPGWITTTRVVSPGTVDDSGQVDERWAGVGMADRRKPAAQRIRAWTATHHVTASLRIALPQGPGADLLFDRLTQDLAAISVSVTRVPEDAAADLRLVDVVARTPRQAWFLDQLSCAGDRFACSPAADGFAARARAAIDPATAAGLYAQAEASLTQENVYIPIGVPIRWSLVAGDGAGFAVNRWGLHTLIALATGDR
ncbi:MAG: ABC transporter substrate-binding protein [Pseudomonadota bacterium]|nr:ABC transporter substrate-binding protein [Pseudomonadota bacterium]